MLLSQDKNEIITSINHQSRVLVNGIIGFTEVLMDEQPTDEQREYLNIIQSSANKLWELMQETLVFSQGSENILKTETVGPDAKSSQAGITNLTGPNKLAETQKLSGRVLVIEDDKTNQLVLSLLLEKMGLEVTVANDGHEAVEEAQEESFDLIFMDMEMPKLSGYEATEMLRAKGVKGPIIALTGHAMKGDREKCIRAGCDDYFAKPISYSMLHKIITKYFNNSEFKH